MNDASQPKTGDRPTREEPTADDRPRPEIPSAKAGPPLAKSAAEARRRALAAWTFLKPRLWQTAINLRVWVPMLSNPGIEARRVRLWARECRQGLRWQFDLPRRCWKCGRTDDLVGRRFEQPVRSFKSPLVNAASAAGVTVLFALWASIFNSFFVGLLALVSILAGFAVVIFRSWTETVELDIWSCREHEGELRPPDMVVDQGELVLYTPTAELAGAANAILASRRRRDSANRGSPRSASSEPMSAGGGAPPSLVEPPKPGELFGNRPPKPDLPPIKLAGEEHEDESGADSTGS